MKLRSWFESLCRAVNDPAGGRFAPTALAGGDSVRRTVGQRPCCRVVHGPDTWLIILGALVIAKPARAVVIVTLPKPASVTASLIGPHGTVVAGPSVANGTKIVLDTGAAASKGQWVLVAVDPATG